MKKIYVILMIMLMCCLTACDSSSDGDTTEIAKSEEKTVLTVNNCEELSTILNSMDMDYKTFAEKYDGCYVEFNAYVYSHLTYWGDAGHVIDVAGGDGSSDTAPGLIIRIGDKSWGHSIDTSVEEGDLVFVSGKIDLSQCKYYKQLYVECKELKKR